MAYSRPYIMDLPGMNDKLDGRHREAQPEAIPPPRLKEIIREFVRLQAHCDCARKLCSDNVGKIINNEDPLPYPTLPTDCP
jgi:hypothetical protein